MPIELKVRFPVDNVELSALHHRAFSPDSPDADVVTEPWASRLERYSVTWVGAFSAGDWLDSSTPSGTAVSTRSSWTPQCIRTSSFTGRPDPAFVKCKVELR